MCGIAGFQGSFDPELLGRMIQRIAHRGPDGTGEATFPSDQRSAACGLAHRRLAIIDLTERGDQPMAIACERCGSASINDLALTYNGEIYNYRELRSRLAEVGHRFSSDTDSEVLLHLYGEEGLAALSGLNGIFAFAIRDNRAGGRPSGVDRGDLILARDPIGVKPLYYSQLEDGLVFASEIKALTAVSSLSREIDAPALQQQMAYLWTPSPRTALESVKKLEPGCAMIGSNGRLRNRWRYYELPFTGEYLSGSASKVAEGLHDVLTTAVERQMVADVPVGAFLSGGVDSSSVAALMRKARPNQHLPCYCIDFESHGSFEGSPPDLPYARHVAAVFGLDLTVVETSAGVIRRLDEMLYHLDEPQADPAPLNVLMIAEHARDAGLKVLMSGAGGDDLFSGYRRHRALMVDRYWRWLPLSVRGFLATAARSRFMDRLAAQRTSMRRMQKAFWNAELEGDDRLAGYLWWTTAALRNSLFSEEFLDRIGYETAAAPLHDSLSRAVDNEPLNRMLFLELKHFLADHNLNYTDKMGMAAGVEIRVPLLDLEVVSYATAIPPAMKQTLTTGKAVFKQAVSPLLPQEIIRRKKTGFGAPVRRWVRNELREYVDDVLSVEAIKNRGIFDPTTVRRLVAADRAAIVDGAYPVFALLCVELWCRQFVDA
jgi:asparagine synthase (glutamine-hydrolysing)